MVYTTDQLANYLHGSLIGDSDVQCRGASIDSREPLDGKVFFALKGEHTDGHEYVEQAVTNGCSAVVVERTCDVGVPVVIVKDSRKALFRLAEARRSEMRFDAVIAVTGSVGKTTTKDILSCLLGGDAVVSRKSFNNDLGVPLTLLEGENANYLVAEVGANDVGEIEPLAELVQPDIAILTSIEKAHLQGFGNTETVLQEKAKLLSAVHRKGYVILPDSVDISSYSFDATIIRVGQSGAADVKVETGIDNHGFATLEIGGKKVTLSLLGEHNAMNTALAIVATNCANLDVPISALLDFACHAASPIGRLRKVEVGGVIFIDDSYNANPASMRAALHLFTQIEATRKILVLGDMLELGESSHSEHRALASVIEQACADVVFLFGDEMQAAAHIPNSFWSQKVETKMEEVVSSFKQGDLVLVKGSRGLRLERFIENTRQTKVSEH